MSEGASWISRCPNRWMIYFISIVTIAMTRGLKREISDLVSMAADERMSESLIINKTGRIVVMLSLGMMGAGLGQHVLKPQRVEEKPKIDGVLNEVEWGRAATISNLGQVEPREGAKPSERTEVRLMRTDEALYLGVTCFDGTPAGVLARDRRRDSTGSGDDRL